MGCQPCEERKARLAEAAREGTPLPPKDWAFYAGWAIAVTAVGYLVYQRYRKEAGK